MAQNPIIDAAKLDEIEHVIETLDSADLLGDQTIHPITKKFITDPEYDKLYGKNGSERACLLKNRPDSRIFKGVNAANVDFSKAAKCVHNPPMTSIDKADGTKVKKYKRLGEWMLDCLKAMRIDHQPYTRDLFKTDVKEDPSFVEDIKKVEAALEVLAEKKAKDGKPVFVQSLKHDGCAVSMYYKGSKLEKSGNRPRDGVNAASVLDHVKQVTGIPNSLLVQSLDIVVRGEIEQKISDFEKVNAAAKASGEKTYENPRNSTAGAMNPLGDPKVAGKRKLSFVGYSILNHTNAPYTTAMDRAIWANKTLKVPFIRINPFVFADLSKIELDVRPKLDYQIDGIIIEVNDLEEAEAMGNQGDKPTGDPRAKLAWKFAAERGKAVVKEVKWSMKRTGKCTPVAWFDAVRLAGTNVRKCTIHNAKQLIEGKVGVGAEILIYKAGEIIPYWEDTLTPAPKVEVPDSCPSCKSKLKWSASDTDLLCVNKLCPAQQVEGLVHYVQTFGVKGIADSTVDSLIEGGLVQTFGDFYRLTPDRMVKEAGFTYREAVLDYARIHMLESPDKEKDDDKLFTKAKSAAGHKKTISLGKFIAALGIPGSGKGTGSALQGHFGDLAKIRSASVAEFESCSDVGAKTAGVLHDWFLANNVLLDDLLQYVDIEKPKTGIFSGKTFCFSGAVDKERWTQAVEDEGAKVVGAPSKKTDYFVYGSGSGLKLDKANELKTAGVKIEIMEVDGIEKLLGLDKNDARLF